ncbi:hypothetical protein ABS767_10710 [Sphingomonas sp. ST-64]|uniref:Uncharacterized protein n=1 Tax=Sphingomonas plantiphila TaxID=3163295 RepID=A0ABW8YNF4_9SPHN
MRTAANGSSIAESRRSTKSRSRAIKWARNGEFRVARSRAAFNSALISAIDQIFFDPSNTVRNVKQQISERNVLSRMSINAPRQTNGTRDSGYWVDAPRVTDPIGFVLRDAYARDQNIPDDMAALLRQLVESPRNGGSEKR